MVLKCSNNKNENNEYKLYDQRLKILTRSIYAFTIKRQLNVLKHKGITNPQGIHLL